MNFTRTTNGLVLAILGFGLAFNGYSQSFLTNGLAAYYPFNGNADDASGNGNSGAVSGAVLATDRFGNSNGAYYFDGVRSMISIPDFPGADASNHTVSVWMKGNSWRDSSTKDYEAIIGKDGGTSVNRQWVFQIAPITGQFQSGLLTSLGDQSLSSTRILQTNTWYQLVQVWDGVSNSIFVNGRFDSSRATTGSAIQSDVPVNIGGNPVTQQYFPGVIDDIRIYNRALSSNEVAQLYAIESTPPRGDTSLVAWWKANGDATDSAGTNNAAMHGVTFAPGISGQAFALPECDAPPCNTGFLTAPQNDAWNFGTNDFSILLWANFAQTTTTASSDQALLSHDDMNSTKWIFWLHQGNTLGFHTEDGPGAPLMFPISQSFTPTVGQWYCLALTRNWETKTYSLWVNGQVIGQTIGDTNAVPSANAPLYIGQAENSNPVYGELENIYVFSRALSANDVQYLYENPGASPLPQTPPAGFQTNGLVAYYPFNGNANDASVVYHK